jgi:hypothetical protein
LVKGVVVERSEVGLVEEEVWEPLGFAALMCVCTVLVEGAFVRDCRILEV